MPLHARKTFMVTQKDNRQLSKALDCLSWTRKAYLIYCLGKEVSYMSAKGLEKDTGLHKPKKTELLTHHFFPAAPFPSSRVRIKGAYPKHDDPPWKKGVTKPPSHITQPISFLYQEK